MTEPREARKALDDLDALLKEEWSMDDDDAIALRMADIDIELTALEQTADRTDRDDIRWKAVILKSAELGERIAAIGMDILGWYALPDDRPGENELPVGPVSGARERSAFLAQLAADHILLMRLRDELAMWLAALDRASV